MSNETNGITKRRASFQSARAEEPVEPPGEPERSIEATGARRLSGSSSSIEATSATSSISPSDDGSAKRRRITTRHSAHHIWHLLVRHGSDVTVSQLQQADAANESTYLVPGGQTWHEQGTPLHYASQIQGIEPQVLLYLLERSPQAARLMATNPTRNTGALPIHLYLGQCFLHGTRPNLPVVQAMLQAYPECCVIRPVSHQDRATPLEEAFFFPHEIAQCIIETYIGLVVQDQNENTMTPKMTPAVVIPKETNDGECLEMTPKIAKLVARVLPFSIGRLHVDITRWTGKSFLAVMEAITQTPENVLQEVAFGSFPCHLLVAERQTESAAIQAAVAMTQALQACPHLKRLECCARLAEAEEQDTEGHDRDDFELFRRGMTSRVLPVLISNATLVLKHYHVNHWEDLCRFLEIAPTKITLSALVIGGGMRRCCCNRQPVSQQCRLQRLTLDVCIFESTGTLEEVLRVAAHFRYLQALEIFWLTHANENDITEALIGLFEGRGGVEANFRTSSLRHLYVHATTAQFPTTTRRPVVNHRRLCQVLQRSNNTSLHHYEYVFADDQHDAEAVSYLRIQYLIALNQFGRAKVRAAGATLPTLVQLISQAEAGTVTTPAGDARLMKRSICYGLLRESPHLWSYIRSSTR